MAASFLSTIGVAAVAIPGISASVGASKSSNAATTIPARPQSSNEANRASIRMATSKPSATPSSSLVGPAPKAARARITLYLPLRDMAAAKQLVEQVSSPTSADHGDYLTPAEFRARFSPTAATVADVTRFLRSRGLDVVSIPSNRISVTAEGTIAQLEKTFGTGINEYRSGDQLTIAASASLTMPASLRDKVLAIEGLGKNDGVQPMHIAAPPTPVFANAGPCSAYWGQQVATNLPPVDGQSAPWAACGYTPEQIQQGYGITPLLNSGITGQGETVAIVDAYASPTIASDLSDYSLRMGQPQMLPGQFRQKATKALRNTLGSTACGGAQGWYSEETLDVEAVHATAPGTNILYVGAASCSDADLIAALNKIVDGHLADVITDSWSGIGEPTAADAQVWNQLFIQAAAEGITVNFSSGDYGDDSSQIGAPAVNFPASSPWVTAVGGTSAGIGADGQMLFQSYWGTSSQTLGQGGWGQSTYQYGGGGGTSSVFAEPWYQSGVVPASEADATGIGLARVVPDVAMIADPTTGMLIGQTQTFPDGEVGYSQFRIGGTSLASPAFAGVEALIDQAAGKPQGFINPALYSLAGTAAFSDITSPTTPIEAIRADYVNGLNDAAGEVISLQNFDQLGSLESIPGFDNSTGLGAPQVQQLVSHFELGG